ncbi:ABC transporter family substrate-binding protein [Xylanimonas allomyrinae]|uniref:ABC transporter family substrate-binding protein n=1 Tax=Xylanimonas allomyrinae TaxID=2509459 RepID=A0A4P6ER24_9MICO|nr:ABC transporter family substrate-binding protein [Xylanimonas allomyrinae]QAY63919.1 ABC transporter family substrate-binding protein [Xylanimonas allomyrinae]
MKSMRKTSARAAVVVTALALALSACSSGGNNADSGEHDATAKQPAAGFDAKTMGSNYPMPEAGVAYDNTQDRDALQQGGTLTLDTSEIGPNWNSFSTDGNTLYMAHMWQLYQPQLWDYDVSGNPTPNPDYLTKVEVTSEDPLVVTYDVNPKATWNDGTPIDWTAFEATWKTQSGQTEGYNPPSTTGYDQVKSVEQGKDAKQAVVTFSEPFYPYQVLFGNLENPKAVDVDTYTQGWVNNPHNEWAAGPFKVDSFDDTQATFVPNDKWWGDKPLLDKIQFKVMDPSASINAFQNGEIDVTDVTSADRLKVAQGMDNTTVRVNYALSSAVVTLNTKADALKDQAVREALTQSIDRTKLAEIKFQGLNWHEDPLGSEIMFPFQEGYEDNMPADATFSAETAGKTLEAAGYAKNSSTGIYEKDGKALSIKYTFFGDSPTQAAIANAVQAMGKAAGIDVQLDNQDPSKFSDVVIGGKYEMLIMGWSASDPYGYSTSGCQLYCSDSDSNFTYIGTPANDTEFKKAGLIEDTSKAIAQLNKAEKAALKLYGTFPLYNGPQMVAAKAGLANFSVSSQGGTSGFKDLNWHAENIGWQK